VRERQLGVAPAVGAADAGGEEGGGEDGGRGGPAEIAVAVSGQLFQRDRSEGGGERGGREGMGREAMFGHPVAAREEDEDDGGGAAREGDERGAARAAGDQRQRTGVERPVPGIGEEPVVEVPEAAVV